MTEFNYKRLQLYITSACNLNCDYCYQKNNKHIDIPQNVIANYIAYLSKRNDIKEITELELWGGEPILGLAEFTKHFRDIVQLMPNLNTISFSSNFTYSILTSILLNFIQTISQYKKNFTINIQISIDGYSEINDLNRGKDGVNFILKNFNQLIKLIPENNIQINFSTNSCFGRNNIYMIEEYEDVSNWFDFFLNNFICNKKNIHIQHKLFKPIEGISWTNEDGKHFAQLLYWANQWRENHPEESKKFIWLDYKPNELIICANAHPYDTLSLTSNGKETLCHKATWENHLLSEKLDENGNYTVPGINLTKLIGYIKPYYKQYSEYLNQVEFMQASMIYINLNFCPYDYIYHDDWKEVFLYQIPLWYNGAMNILLEWSKKYGLD